jgi:hypothetical protein
MKTITILMASFIFNQLSAQESILNADFNGRLWGELSDYSKGAVVTSIDQGMSLTAEKLAFSHNLTKNQKHIIIDEIEPIMMGSGFTYGELTQMIDEFYRDRSNIIIPIAVAYVYSVKKAKGEAPDSLENYLAKLRRVWNKKAEENKMKNGR